MMFSSDALNRWLSSSSRCKLIVRWSWITELKLSELSNSYLGARLTPSTFHILPWNPMPIFRQIPGYFAIETTRKRVIQRKSRCSDECNRVSAALRAVRSFVEIRNAKMDHKMKKIERSQLNFSIWKERILRNTFKYLKSPVNERRKCYFFTPRKTNFIVEKYTLSVVTHEILILYTHLVLRPIFFLRWICERLCSEAPLIHAIFFLVVFHLYIFPDPFDVSKLNRNLVEGTKISDSFRNNMYAINFLVQIGAFVNTWEIVVPYCKKTFFEVKRVMYRIHKVKNPPRFWFFSKNKRWQPVRVSLKNRSFEEHFKKWKNPRWEQTGYREKFLKPPHAGTIVLFSPKN